MIAPAKAAIAAQLAELAGQFLTALEKRLGAREGIVRTDGDPPYRRADLGARALCYVRCRAKLGYVRVDVSGLWGVPPIAAHRAARAVCLPSAHGLTVVLCGAKDIDTAVTLIAAVVEAGREATARHAAPREV